MSHWFYDSSLSENSDQLPAEEAKHAAASLRIGVGETLQITNGVGLVAQAEVVSLSKSSLRYQISQLQQHNRRDLNITLIQALAKSDRDELAIQTSVELGVSEVMPWESARSIVRWDAAKQVKGIARWQQIAIEAMKQSQQPFLAKVQNMFSPTSKLEDQVLVLDPTASKSLTEVELDKKKKIQLIVGPEGGISEQELGAFDQLGYQRVHLGSAILRTSTAGPAAVATIKTMLQAW